MTTADPADLVEFTVRLSSAYLSRNAVSPDQIAWVMNEIHGSLGALGRQQPEPSPLKPAVSIKKSITPDYLVCLDDGKQLKMLKRHLRTTYDMTPAEYRAKWGLPSDYPMVAPNYAQQRSELAKRIGLGTTATALRRKGRGRGKQAGKT